MFIVLNIYCFVAYKLLECLHGLIILCSLRGQCFRIYFNRLIFCEDDRKCSVKIGEVCGSQPHKILYLVLKNKKNVLKLIYILNVIQAYSLEEIVHSRCLVLKANMGENNDSANPTF